MGALQAPRWGARVAKGLAISVGLLAIGGFLGSLLLERMIFQPTRGVAVTPERLGLSSDEAMLESSDGVRVHAYWLPAEGASRAILFLHGNAGNASHRLPNAGQLVQLGASVLLLDYRGYGRSEGRPTEAGVYRDARAALDHLVSVRGVPEQRVVLFGRSLGGAVAVELAQDRDLAGVILESTFTSISDIARGFGGPLFGALASNRFESSKKIARVRAPVLFFHGDRDRIIANALGRKLFELAPTAVAFETISGAGHNDTVARGGPPYFQRLREFLDEVAPEPARAE